MNEKHTAPHEMLKEAKEALLEYKRDKAALEARLEREREVWRDVYGQGHSSSWIFNSIVNKHADIIDSIPTCICLPREKKDEQDARALSEIIPVITQRCGFDATYSDNAWQKLKHGVALYGVFWNNAADDGLGDVDIRGLPIENVFWESGVLDIADSKNLFICAFCDRDELEQTYTDLRYDEVKESDRALCCALYGGSVSDGKCLVVDRYYKKYNDMGERELHLMKFVGDRLLYSSELEGLRGGWYAHGEYPVVIDRLYPEEGTPCGFGLIAVAQEAQNYVNKIDGNLLSYSDWASRVRFWAKRSLGVNEKEFLDLDRSIVEVEGDVDEEKLRQIEIGEMDGSIIDVKRMKIEEIKEITGSRDVSQGGVTGGVTAASAISILRESGAKSSRDGIEESYRAYLRIISQVIELIRQFYDETRVFRIIGESGECNYLSFSGRSIRAKENALKPHFDIEVSALKKSPTETEQKNQFAKELFEKGAFKRENINETLMMLEMMSFDGIGKIRSMLKMELGETET